MGIMRLADKHSKTKLESACRKAMECSGTRLQEHKGSHRNIEAGGHCTEEKRED